jgi:hypothetical protein
MPTNNEVDPDLKDNRVEKASNVIVAAKKATWPETAQTQRSLGTLK